MSNERKKPIGAAWARRGAALLALLASLIWTASAAAFEIEEFTGLVSDPGGSSYTQAAGHPAAASTTLTFPLVGPFQPVGQVKDAIVDLPPGFIGNPQALAAKCTQVQLLTSKGDIPRPGGGLPGATRDSCPYESQVGTAHIFTNGLQDQYSNVYAMQPPFGSPARFGFYVQGVPVYLDVTVRSGDDYGISIGGLDIATPLAIQKVVVSIWGVPYAEEHDGSRGFEPFLPAGGVNWCASLDAAGEPCENSSPFAPVAFLTNPADCSAGPLTVAARATEWAQPSVVHRASFTVDENGNPTAVTGCDKVPFQPDISITPGSHQADSPTGLDVELTMPQDGLTEPGSLAEANLKRAEVTLPEGMTVNPASADGLGACSAQQIGLLKPAPAPKFTAAPDTCPDSSKIGTFEVETPLLEHSIQGSIRLGMPDDPNAAGDENPFGSLLALYLTADDPQSGIVLKLPGRVDLDPGTGRLFASFDDNPQLPFSRLQLHFTQGSRAALVTPPSCGNYQITTRMSSWSALDPDHPTASETVEHVQPYVIDRGPGGGPCPAAGEFAPSFQAGTVSPLAAIYSPLVVNAARPDGSAPLTALELNLPPGLTGKLAGIPYCSDAALASAAGKEGLAEQASASCPTASQVGTVQVQAGAGTTPFRVAGKAYLAGPYKGAPISIAVITPAVAGPFDLGTVVVRAKADIDPRTAQVRLSSDPLPTILDGIPLKVRSVSINTDRPEFTLNPTNCEPMSLAGSLLSPPTTRMVASHFQVSACQALDFAPKLSLRVFGKTNRNSKPRFRAVLQTKPGEANIARAQVNLPRSEFLEQGHIKTVCTRVQFAAGNGHGSACPQDSIYGHARAFTPLLDQPLEGPVFLRSSSHKLPDLVAALNGQVDVELQGKVDSGPNRGLRNTFEVVPDAPVTKFVLDMAGGRKGLLVNSENLCSPKAKTRAIVRFTAQNGAVHQFKPKVANDCRKKGRRR